MKVCIICANGQEESEALLTYDLLYRAGLEVDLLGLDEEIISSHKVTFKTNQLLKDANIDEYDCLVLPGGMPGTTNLENSPLVQETIDTFVKENKLIAAVCAAPSILIHKGLLNDNEFTCFPGFESGKVSTNLKAMKTRNIITGIGLGGVIEFSSLIISTLLNEETAKKVIDKIKY